MDKIVLGMIIATAGITIGTIAYAVISQKIHESKSHEVIAECEMCGELKEIRHYTVPEVLNYCDECSQSVIAWSEAKTFKAGEGLE